VFVWIISGSVSPSKGRARSTGPAQDVRRSRADAPRKPTATEDNNATATTAADDQPPTATGKESESSFPLRLASWL